MPSLNCKSIFYILDSVTVLKRNLIILLTIVRHFLSNSKVKRKFHLWASTHHMSNTSSHNLPVSCANSVISSGPSVSQTLLASMPLNLKVPQPLLSTPLLSQYSKLLLGGGSTSSVTFQLSQSVALCNLMISCICFYYNIYHTIFFYHCCPYYGHFLVLLLKLPESDCKLNDLMKTQ